MSPFPSMKARRLLAVLERQPLGYEVVRQSGSHRRMQSPDHPPLTFAFHDGATIPAGWSARSSSKTLDLMRRKLGSYSDVEDQMETVRVIYHHETDGWWAESPDVEGWSAAGNSYQEVAKLAEEGIRFALERDDVALENFVPLGDSVAA